MKLRGILHPLPVFVFACFSYYNSTRKVQTSTGHGETLACMQRSMASSSVIHARSTELNSGAGLPLTVSLPSRAVCNHTSCCLTLQRFSHAGVCSSPERRRIPHSRFECYSPAIRFRPQLVVTEGVFNTVTYGCLMHLQAYVCKQRNVLPYP